MVEPIDREALEHILVDLIYEMDNKDLARYAHSMLAATVEFTGDDTFTIDWDK